MNEEQRMDLGANHNEAQNTIASNGPCRPSSPPIQTNASEKQQFKLPMAKDTPTPASSQGSIQDCTSQTIKPLTVTRHYSAIEMSTSQESVLAGQKPPTSVPKRKTSVFSHNGFTGIHKLDQDTIQQHPIVSDSCIASKQDVQIENHHQVENKSQQPQQNTSLRRPNRSDTLGSTGSSRASSCDEPTIVSPSKLFAPTLMQAQQHQQQQKQQNDLKQTTSTNLISKSPSPDSNHESLANEQQPESTTLNKLSEKSEIQSDQLQKKLDISQDDSSNDDEDDEADSDDDDVVFSAQNSFTGNKDSTNLKIPPFESIKTQLMRNSIPNAQDITRHIENLISRNEEIMENWNQVSIRSYNTSSQATSTTGASNRRPSKRWSTTCIGKTNSGIERKCSYNQATRRLQQIPICKQQVLPQIRTTIDELKPPNVSLSMPTSPKQSSNPSSDAKNFLVDRFVDLPMNHNFVSSGFANSQQQHQSIENAIRNLSLRKREDDQLQRHQQHQAPYNQIEQRDDIVMAAIMVERQRQQQLLENYLRVGAHQPGDQQFHTNQILDQIQQQQLIEQHLALNRIAAIEDEFQQQQQRQHLAASLMTASLQNQQQNQQQLSSSQQLVHQFNCLTANQALENQLLNEYISKIVLSRDEIYKSQSRELASTSRDQSNLPSPTSPSRLYLGHGTEMLTQSLDSATPSHRCEACDISFWTRDLLNYHTMTSCSARKGPGPAKPIAFNFNHPNGFDATTTSNQMQQSMINNTSGQSPAVFVSHVNDNYSGTSTCHSVNEQLQSKSVSPIRRRTYNELDAPLSEELSQQMRHPKRQSTSSMFNHHHVEHENQNNMFAFNGGDRLMPPRSPHEPRGPVDFALQKKLDPTSVSVLSQHKQHVTINGGASNLPIKKRKISEPNMRY